MICYSYLKRINKGGPLPINEKNVLNLIIVDNIGALYPPKDNNWTQAFLFPVGWDCLSVGFKEVDSSWTVVGVVEGSSEGVSEIISDVASEVVSEAF